MFTVLAYADEDILEAVVGSWDMIMVYCSKNGILKILIKQLNPAIMFGVTMTL